MDEHSHTICVIDSGVDLNHPDLQGQLWVNDAEANGMPGVDDDGNGFIDDIFGANPGENNGNVMDDNSHGTHVSGTIGAVPNNSIGISGVTGKSKILTCKFLSSKGTGTLSNALRCLDYCIANGGTISNNSWSGGTFSQAFQEGLSAADQGTIYPSMYTSPSLISVGAK
eukprot:GHVP01046870.1.p2 GENE.GHVP01046870.1~~GHVP01046870.1.p2  ORF type:complete len:169 (-),score=20.06 GHVP01046870.1:1449-1955(-)